MQYSDRYVFTTAEALTVMGRKRFEAQVRSGKYIRMHRNVYRDAACSRTFLQEARGALVACGTGAVISHQSAAQVHGWLPRSAKQHVVIPLARRVSRPGIVVHRLREHGRELPMHIDGLAVTTPVQTMVDLAAVMPEPELIAWFRRVADRSLAMGVRQSLCRTGLQGRRGARLLRRLASALLSHPGNARRLIRRRARLRPLALTGTQIPFASSLRLGRRDAGRNVADMSTGSDPTASDSSMVDHTTIDGTPASAPASPETRWGAGTQVTTFEELYRSDFRQVLGLAFVLTGDRQTAEEVAQEAFVAAYRRWSTICRYDAPGAWVRRVACNHAASRIRRRMREARALLRLGDRNSDAIALDRSDHEFWSAVRTLPNRQAQVVALHYLEDLSVADIAGILVCSEGTVKTHLSRARQAIAEQLKEGIDE